MIETLKHIRQRAQRLQFPRWSIPLALAAVCLLAYGLLAAGQGFYWDEWNLIYKAVLQRSDGLQNYLNIDGHPQDAWFYILAFKLLGLRPLNWQLFSLAWRTLSVIGFWLVIDRIWKNRPLETCMAALFFALYPFFYVQAEAMVYVDVWFGYCVLWASFYFSIRAVQSRERRWLFLTLALLFKLAHCFTTDYTWGTELMRPFLLWFALPAAVTSSLRQRLKGLTLAALPYLLITAGVYYWRLAIFRIPVRIEESHGHIFILDHLLKRPLDTLWGLFSTLVPDLVSMLFSAWQRPLNPALFYLGDKTNLLILALMLFTGLALSLYLRRVDLPQGEPQPITRSGLTAGLAGMIFGMLPFYAAGYIFYIGFQSQEPDAGRFILGSLAGVALLLTALLDLFVSAQPGRRAVLFALITALMLGWQMQAINQYRQIARTQQEFYSELLWRAPGIRPGTGFVVPEKLLPINHAMSFTINLLYTKRLNPGDNLPYGVQEFSAADLAAQTGQLVSGQPVNFHRYNDVFAGRSLASLYLTFNPQAGQCLWLVNPDQANYGALSAVYRPLAAVNAFRRILPDDSATNQRLIRDVFGGAPAAVQPWCYYFEKADLARQYRDWPQVVALWKQASAQSLAAGSGIEYMPFIEAFARQSDWKTAFTLTKTALRISPDAGAAYQIFWSRLSRSTPDSEEKTYTLGQLNGLWKPAP